MLPFDLHVLGLPPAFTLSQDQTLHLNFSDRSPNALSAVVFTSSKLLTAFACFELTWFCSNVCKMDNHPLARRPHKSPAHTVKDRRNRPQRLIPFYLLNSPQKRPSEPHIIGSFSLPSTPFFVFLSGLSLPLTAREGRTLWRAFEEVVNNFLPVSFRHLVAAEAPLRGGRIVHGSNAFGKGVREIFFT